MRKTLLASTLEDTGTARNVVWEVAEVFDSLSFFLENHTNSTEFFKRLFHPTEAPNLLVNRLRTLPDPFGTHLASLTTDLYQQIETKVVDSVWLKSKVTTSGVLVRDKTLAVESAVPRAEFVAEVIRCYRNAHHGYFTTKQNQSRPSRFLFLVDGNLPSELSALPSLWWLAYLADTTFVGWQTLPISCFM